MTLTTRYGETGYKKLLNKINRMLTSVSVYHVETHIQHLNP